MCCPSRLGLDSIFVFSQPSIFIVQIEARMRENFSDGET
jgi:hypothetical protein